MVNPSPAFHIMAKPTGATCNMQCRYCFFLKKENLYPGSNFRMTDELLETYIRQLLESNRTPEVTVAWQGGEPTLMGLDFFRRSMELEGKYARPGQRIANSIQTNGTLLDDEWGSFLKENGFLVGISIDGPREIHDAFRVDKGGKPTFDRVMRGLGYLRKHGVEWNALTTVHAANAGRGREVYRFLRDECGATFIQFIPIVERPSPGGIPTGSEVTDRSITPEGYGRFLIDVFEEWVRRDVGEVFVQMFDVTLANKLGLPPGLCVHSETCGLALALEHNGDLYSCDHFVQPDHLLGNIQQRHMRELVGSSEQRRFGRDKREALPGCCRRCDVLSACRGGCPKDRFVVTPEGEPGLNYLCAGFKAFFHHVDEPMRMMGELLREERPAAEIMHWYSAEDSGRGPNEPCTCGSGKRWKDCHGDVAASRRGSRCRR